MPSFMPMEMPHVEAALRDAANGSPESRWVAACALGVYCGERIGEAKDALIRLASDPLEEVRAQALEGLFEQASGGSLKINESIIIDALNDNTARVRCVAVEMASFALENPIESLLPLLKDQDSSVRAATVAMLGELNAHHQGEIAGLLKDSDGLVRIQAAMALSRMNDPRGEDVLLEAMQSSEDLDEIIVALARLESSKLAPRLRKIADGWFGSPEIKALAAVVLIKEDGTKRIENMLDSRSRRTKMAATAALFRLPSLGTATLLEGLLDSDQDEDVSSVIQTLAAIAKIDKSAISVLEKRRGKLEGDLNIELEETLTTLKD